MLTDYIQAAMRQAKYEILEDGTYYGEIPPCQGVITNADNLEECREMLLDALETWILYGLKFGDEIPVIDGININVEMQPQEVA
jgi:predicted RNase H-like HicB family nuclease